MRPEVADILYLHAHAGQDGGARSVSVPAMRHRPMRLRLSLHCSTTPVVLLRARDLWRCDKNGRGQKKGRAQDMITEVFGVSMAELYTSRGVEEWLQGASSQTTTFSRIVYPHICKHRRTISLPLYGPCQASRQLPLQRRH